MWKNAGQDGHEKHQENNLKDGFPAPHEERQNGPNPWLHHLFSTCQLSPILDILLTTEQCHKIFKMKSPL